MINNESSDIVFGKAIGQIIHDIRNPLNTIIGFSSILKIDETVNEEVKDYIKKIFYSGMSIEKLLSNIDFYMMDEYDVENIEFEAVTVAKNYLESQEDFFDDKQLKIEYFFIDKINITFPIEIFNKILDNLLQFSLKGLRTVKNKGIQISFHCDDKNLIIIYSDSSAPVFIENDFFTFDELIKSRRGLGVMFIEKHIKHFNGAIKYNYGKNWQTIVSSLEQKITNNHGFIIQLPLK